VLGKAVVLETMTVSARATDLQMASFEENRRLGLGHFMTRAEIGKYDGMKLAGPLSQMIGLGVANGKQGNAWVMSKHTPVSMCTTKECFIRHGFYVPENQEKLRGMPVACYAQVYLDNILMTGNRTPTEPFDINSIAPERIEAIEYYAGGAETPLKYSRAGSECGVLVLWTRR
jgi:hypothetical protein